MIVAGVTGTDPEATELMRAVTALPNGALVLPALDHTLDEESWALIDDHPEHPQFGLKKLIDALGLSRADVRPLGASRAHAGRARPLVARVRGHAACRHHRAVASLHGRRQQEGRWRPR